MEPPPVLEQFTPPPAPEPPYPSTPSDADSSDPDLELDDDLRFKGEIIVVKRYSEVEYALSKLFDGDDAHKQGLGFDMEWQPEWTKGQVNPISVIQLATNDVAVLFLMQHLGGMPFQLRQILASKTVLKIGQALDTRDSEKLLQEFGLSLVRTVDVSQVARNMGIRKTGLKNLALSVFGVKLNKRLATSDWGRWTLTPQQIAYAATDAFVTRKLYYALLSSPPESLLFQQAVMWQQQQQIQQEELQLEHDLMLQRQQQQQHVRQRLKQQRKQQRHAQKQRQELRNRQKSHSSPEPSMLPLDMTAYPPLPSKPPTSPEDSPILSKKRDATTTSTTKSGSPDTPPPPLSHYLQTLQKPAPPSPAPPPPPQPQSPSRPQSAHHSVAPARAVPRGGSHPLQQRQPPSHATNSQYNPKGSYPAGSAPQKNYCQPCKKWFRNGHALRQHNRALHIQPQPIHPGSPTTLRAATAPLHHHHHHNQLAPTTAKPDFFAGSLTLTGSSITTVESSNTTDNTIAPQPALTTPTTAGAPTPTPISTGTTTTTTTITATTPLPPAPPTSNSLASNRPPGARPLVSHPNMRCPVCGITFSSLKACKQHQQDKKHFAYFCPHCNVPFATRSACEQHQLAKKHMPTDSHMPMMSAEDRREFGGGGHSKKEAHEKGIATDRGVCSCAGCRMRMGNATSYRSTSMHHQLPQHQPPQPQAQPPQQQPQQQQQAQHMRAAPQEKSDPEKPRGTAEEEEAGRRKGSGTTAHGGEKKKEEEGPNPLIMNLLRELQRMPPQPHPAAWAFTPVFPHPRVMDARGYRNF